MFSNEDIQKALDSGELKITPFTKKHLRSAGITFHLGAQLLKPLPGRVIDVKRGILPEYREITITDETPYQLEPQEFVLGHTYENVTVGLQLGFLIEGRSTLGRMGLTVVKTAMIVQPGHEDRTITLELANHGPNPILLYPKMRIAKAVVFRLTSPTSKAYDLKGKYRAQESVGPPVLEDEFLLEEV
jgi:dCTP deaminase